MSLLLYVLSVIVSVSVLIVCFLLVSAGDLRTFKKIYGNQKRSSVLPVVTYYGEVITSPQELTQQLYTLKGKLKDKFRELEESKIRMQQKQDSLHSLESFKNTCLKLKADIVGTENECEELQKKIDHLRKLQIRIQEDFSPEKIFQGDKIEKMTQIAK